MESCQMLQYNVIVMLLIAGGMSIDVSTTTATKTTPEAGKCSIF